MGYDFELAERSSIVHPSHGDERFTLSIDGSKVRASIRPTQNAGEFVLDLDGQVETVYSAICGDVHFVHFRGRVHRVDAINALERAQRDAAPSDLTEFLRAPMPGVVVNVVVKQGTEVEAGELLMTIESMKLETPILAPQASRVAELFLLAGASFEQGANLVRLEARGEEDGESE